MQLADEITADLRANAASYAHLEVEDPRDAVEEIP